MHNDHGLEHTERDKGKGENLVKILSSSWLIDSLKSQWISPQICVGVCLEVDSWF